MGDGGGRCFTNTTLRSMDPHRMGFDPATLQSWPSAVASGKPIVTIGCSRFDRRRRALPRLPEGRTSYRRRL